jgi:nucleolar GTP-binding protein
MLSITSYAACYKYLLQSNTFIYNALLSCYMSLRAIPKVETADFYIDLAFRKGKEKAGKLPIQRQEQRKSRILSIETTRVGEVGRDLAERLRDVIRSFPEFDGVSPFYLDLVKATIDFDELKHSLGGVNWAVHRIDEFTKHFLIEMRSSGSEEVLKKVKREYYGRVSSAVKQIKKPLAFLEDARLKMRKFPVIKTSLPTVIIAGYPNVGKTTLLSLLTGSTPKIASYPFTTQQLMIGYALIGEQKFQFIDTPGLLDRPLKERNSIELQAILALKHISAKIIFVIDASDSCGYSIEDQISLMRQIEKSFGIPVIPILSKSDITPADALAEARKALKTEFVVSSGDKKAIEELKKSFI